jgi:hypothetical protein
MRARGLLDGGGRNCWTEAVRRERITGPASSPATVQGTARRLELRHQDYGHLQTLLTIASPYPAGWNLRIAIGLLQCNVERDAFPQKFASPQLEV